MELLLGMLQELPHNPRPDQTHDHVGVLLVLEVRDDLRAAKLVEALDHLLGVGTVRARDGAGHLLHLHLRVRDGLGAVGGQFLFFLIGVGCSARSTRHAYPPGRKRWVKEAVLSINRSPRKFPADRPSHTPAGLSGSFSGGSSLA